MYNSQKIQIILGVTQGIAELVPISSSMHLAAIPKIANSMLHAGYDFSGYDNVSAKIVAHLGSLVVLLVFFRRECVKDILLMLNGNSRFFGTFAFYSIIVTICTSIMTILFNCKLTNCLDAYDQNVVMIVSNIISALLLYVVDKKCQQNGRITIIKACIIGMIQFFASISGVSRLGITITACRLLKLKRKQSVVFSMFCAMPAILGAIVYDFWHNGACFNCSKDIGTLFMVTIIFGLLCVRYCYSAMIHFGFLWVLIYRLCMSIILAVCR